MSGRVRFGLVGVGAQAADNLIPALQGVEGAEIRAICSRSAPKARALATRYGAAWSTDRWQDLIGATDVDAVMVAATPAVQGEVARACIEKRVHVFVEKPPAADLASLQALARLADDHPGVVTFVDYNFRFGATYRALRDALRGEGAPAAARLRFVGSKPLAPMWGQDTVLRSFLYALGIHAVEMVVDLFGPSRDVQARYRQLDGGHFLMDLSIGFDSGATACLELGNYSTRFEYRLELVTTGAASGVLDQHHSLQLTRAKGLEAFDAGFGGKQALAYEWPSLHGGYDLTGYRGAIAAFVDAALHGTASKSPIGGSVEVFRIIEEALAQIEGAAS
jgi:predicted dehydrogenase